MTDIVMPEDVAIKAEGVSKKYCKSLKQSMLYGMQDIGRNLCGLSSRSDQLRSAEFWAVDDVSFEVKKGETLGLIGPNGSGKSTLLKMLNGIFWPDKGKITVKGRVGALIEVGAGFHPLLTGRENVYVNGAIMGMTKQQVDDKFDEIVKFADIGNFIDAPVKAYSSGMFVRLGFAVAVHSEPDILLVDEALAVGDASFRNKCFQKMNKIKTEKTSSIIYVSHDLYTTERFCDKGLYLNRGKIQCFGSVHDAINSYQLDINNLQHTANAAELLSSPHCTKDVVIKRVTFLNSNFEPTTQFRFGEKMILRIEYDAKDVVLNPRFQVSLWSWNGTLISTFGPHLNQANISQISKGPGVIECAIERLPFLANKYYVNVTVCDNTRTVIYDWWGGNMNSELRFEILPNWVSAMMGEYTGICHLDSEWSINGIELKKAAEFFS